MIIYYMSYFDKYNKYKNIKIINLGVKNPSKITQKNIKYSLCNE